MTDKDDLVDRLWESDKAAALTNEAAREIERLRALISDLTYHGSDRGYARGSEMWADAVRLSAQKCRLSYEDVATLIGTDEIAD